MVSTSVCTGRSNMPQAYCIRIVRIHHHKYPYQTKTPAVKAGVFGLCKDYKKDIFAGFSYKLELLQKMKSLLMQGWNQLTLMKSSALPQMKLNPPIRRRGGFHPTKLDFIVEDDFTHPQGWI